MLDEATDVLDPAFSSAMSRKGYTELTSVQRAVLDPALAGRDLRITSQTGSGKTVAIGFVLRGAIAGAPPAGRSGVAKPRALIVAPTRELAHQVEEELSWLFAGLGAKVACTTGGASIRDERRALAAGPALVVGTPGRRLDQLERGAIDGSELKAVVLDEADRLLDMGFREDLEKILGHAPKGHETHLVSATFPREVKALADRVQQAPAHVEGTRLGVANVDIEHVIHLVAHHDRVAAIVNLLLAHEGEQTLIFARTRADVARIAEELERAGFRVGALSGEMEQRERNRAMAGFKSGVMDALVATDVAARGIDVQDVARVLHVEPPGDPDSYTHRSGRTGRAGKKGTSAVLVAPSALVPTLRLLKRAGVSHRFEPIPTASDIRAAQEGRFEQELTADDPEGFAGFDQRTWALAKRLLGVPTASRTMARLITRARAAGAREPRDVRPIEPPVQRGRPAPSEMTWTKRDDRTPPSAHAPAGAARPDIRPPREREPRPPNDSRQWVTFRVTWGETHGADARRMLPIVCRRGEIKGSDVGAIRIGRVWSTVEVAAEVAEAFARAAARPDPRDPRIAILRDAGDLPPQRREKRFPPARRPPKAPAHK